MNDDWMKEAVIEYDEVVGNYVIRNGDEVSYVYNYTVEQILKLDNEEIQLKRLSGIMYEKLRYLEDLKINNEARRLAKELLKKFNEQ